MEINRYLYHCNVRNLTKLTIHHLNETFKTLQTNSLNHSFLFLQCIIRYLYLSYLLNNPPLPNRLWTSVFVGNRISVCN